MHAINICLLIVFTILYLHCYQGELINPSIYDIDLVLLILPYFQC